MKIRCGFVSNSSSASFVLRYEDIPNDLMEQIDSLVRKHNNEFSYDGYLMHGQRHIFGSISINFEELGEFLRSNNIPYEWGE